MYRGMDKSNTNMCFMLLLDIVLRFRFLFGKVGYVAMKNRLKSSVSKSINVMLKNDHIYRKHYETWVHS